MRYPQALISLFGDATAFARAASAHPLAPRVLTRAAVYAWKTRDRVPYAWRPVVQAMTDAATASARPSRRRRAA